MISFEPDLDATGLCFLATSRPTGMKLLGNLPFDEERHATRNRVLQTGDTPLQLHAIRPGPAHRGRLEPESLAHVLEVVGAQTQGMRNGLVDRMMRHPSAVVAETRLAGVDDSNQLEIRSAQGDDAVLGAVARVPAAYHTLKAVLGLEPLRGGAQIPDTEDDVIYLETHLVDTATPGTSDRLPAVKRLSAVLVVAAAAALAAALLGRSDEPEAAADSWSPVEPS